MSLIAGGFLEVSSVLAIRSKEGFTLEDVQRVVDNCPKQRFALREDTSTGELQIRANQGHSMEVSSVGRQINVFNILTTRVDLNFSCVIKNFHM